MAGLLPLLASAATAPAVLPPIGTAAAYEVKTYSGKHVAPGDPIIISHSDGGYPDIRLLRLPDARSGEPRFELGSASSHHSKDPVDYGGGGPSRREQRWLAHVALQESLDHHRPKVIFALSRSDWAATEQVGADAYERCALRTAKTSARRSLAAAEDEQEADSWRRTLTEYPLGSQWNGYEMRAARIMLTLLSLPKLGFGEGFYSKQVREMTAKQLEGPEWEAYSWRNRMIRSHGREFRWDVEASGNGAAARFCRTLEPPKLEGRISDRCSFRGVLDQRDGWPIVIGVERSWKDARGAGSNAGILSYRLPAKTVFVPPPNPCAAALRGGLRRSDR